MAAVEAHLNEMIDNFMKVDPLEEAFVSILLYNSDEEEKAIAKFIDDYIKEFSNLPTDNRDNAVRQLLVRASSCSNIRMMNMLMATLNKLFENHHITPKLMSDKILSCDKLVIENQNFWIECFKLVRKVIDHVDYKGVREIMKACRDKMNLFPVNINVAYLPQLRILDEIIHYIFDRDNCLLPAYFIANEVMKLVPSHWRLNTLITKLIDEFRYTAQMVTIIGQPYMLPIVEHFGYADHIMNSWKIDHTTLKFQLKSSLPYEPEMLEEQTRLLRHILNQPYSKEMVSVTMSLQKQQKQRCNALEEQLVYLIIAAMEKTEDEESTEGGGFNVPEDRISDNELMWLHLSSQLIYFVLFQFISFMHIVLMLYEKLAEKDLRRGRDQLMWILLQFISGSIQKNPITNFLPMFKLFDLLYPEDEPLKLPDYNKYSCLRKMAPICTWIHLMKKARVENMSINRPLPVALKNHYEFLQHMVMPSTMMSYSSLGSDFRIILVCNAYSTNQEYLARPMNILVESLNSSSGQQMSVAPFSMVVLDSLTVHSKMSLIHSFVTQMIKQAQSKTSIPLPALVETYARLLVYTEIESLGVKGLLIQLLPQVCKSHAWGILNVLLEMFSYRLHHVPTHYRVQLLSHLHSLVSAPQANKMQLNLCFESTALRLITDLGSADVQPQLSRYFNEKSPASVSSTESEELNRVLILTLARSMNITGAGEELQPWCRELLMNIMQNTPHTWASQTLACFPPALNEFFLQNSPAVENRQLLKKAVEEEYRNWTSMSNENDIIAHFIRSNANTLFLCLLFKMIWETDTITPVAYKILEGISTRALSAHLRKLCDYLVGEVSTCNGQDFIHKCVDTINNMIWKYNVITIDRVVLCLALRMQEGNEAQVCFLVIQLLLLKTPEMRTRVQEFCKDNNPDHWLQSNWHEKHLNFHQMFPEKFASDESASQPPLPIFFSNVCLRFLPVLDIVLHRFIELPIQPVHQILEVILDQLSILYKFHFRPITYLYSTLHFYEYIFRERPPLKKKLVGSILSAFNEIRPVDWCLSEQYREYMQSPEVLWTPDMKYYLEILRRLTNTILGTKVIYNTDWRFNEFPNAPAHAVYATCVEILALPLTPAVVANSFIDVIFEGYWVIGEDQFHSYINTFGVIFAALPFAYWNVIADRMKDLMNSPKMVEWNYRFTAFEMFNFKTVISGMLERNFAFILAIVHSIMHHMGGFKLATMITILKEKLAPCVRNEHQFIFLCHVFGPFLQRIELEKPNAVAGIAILLYEMLEVVDKHHGPEPLQYMDPICDFLYHIKYIHVGNIIKNESEAVIKRLRPALQMRLRFIAYHSMEEVQAGSEDPTQQQQSETIAQSLKQQSQMFLALQMQQQQQQQILLQQQLPPNPLVLAAMVGGSSLPLPPAPSQPKRQQKDQRQQMTPQMQQQMHMHQQQQQQQQHLQQQFQLQQQIQHLQQQQQMQMQQQQNMNMRHN